MDSIVLFLQLAVILAMIFIGARVGGIGMGIYGTVGVAILVFVFGCAPGELPVDVMLIILCVITASSCLQAAGGLDFMVSVAAKFLRKHPKQITRSARSVRSPSQPFQPRWVSQARRYRPLQWPCFRINSLAYTASE